MTLLYSIDWKKVPRDRISNPQQQQQCDRSTASGARPFRNPNLVAIRATCLNEEGRKVYVTKLYEEWLGVCTENIEAVVREIDFYLPGVCVRYEALNPEGPQHKKVLPYFPERLKRGRLDCDRGTFYKVYVDCPVEDVGRFFRRHEIAYFRNCDWSVRLYIDFCTRYKSDSGFYYKFYELKTGEPRLLDALRMLQLSETIDRGLRPAWTFAAFDIETIPGPAAPRSRIPDGMDPGDRIVMISIVKWKNDGRVTDEKVLYLNPLPFSSGRRLGLADPKYLEYHSESDLLNDFHYFVDDCHVLTGYNIDDFDIPCIFARLLFLGRFDLLSRYSSRKVGKYKLMTFSDKIVLDAITYFRTFSEHGCTNFKLDQVAKAKLGPETAVTTTTTAAGEGRKIAIDSVGIHAWYRRLKTDSLDEAIGLCRSTDARHCYEILGASDRVPDPERFGTFLQYLEYCLRDSQLVRRLFLQENILSFLIARTDFVSLDVVQSMHFGTSQYLLELFHAYGTMLGFYVNVECFQNRTDCSKYASMFENGTYQGALNYCKPETYFENVAALDFTSMYPISLLSSNLCYGTCDVLTAAEYESLDDATKGRITAIPYRNHSDLDFRDDGETYHHHRSSSSSSSHGDDSKNDYEFRYPAFDPRKDEFVIVSDRTVEAFLPTIVKHFLNLRKHHQREWKRTGHAMHYNSQLCIKLLINSMYGTMASKDSPLAYIVVAMAIVTLARYQILGSYHYVSKVLGFDVCYVDTDSLMVHRWPRDDCDAINRFLDPLPYVEIKFEQRMRSLLVISKKRYAYERTDGNIVHVGIGKRINDLVKFMTDQFIEGVLHLRGRRGRPSDGWILWVETLLKALYMCRDPRKYAITRKTRKLSQYVSTTCQSVKILKMHPELEGDFVEYAFSRADVSQKEAENWVMSVKDCQYVNFEKLFKDHFKVFCTLLNFGFWNYDEPEQHCKAVLNTIRWKYFVHVELLHYFYTGVFPFSKKAKKLVLLVERGTKYTFSINDHRVPEKPKIQEEKVHETRRRKLDD